MQVAVKRWYRTLHLVDMTTGTRAACRAPSRVQVQGRRQAAGRRHRRALRHDGVRRSTLPPTRRLSDASSPTSRPRATSRSTRCTSRSTGVEAGADARTSLITTVLARRSRAQGHARGQGHPPRLAHRAARRRQAAELHLPRCDRLHRVAAAPQHLPDDVQPARARPPPRTGSRSACRRSRNCGRAARQPRRARQARAAAARLPARRHALVGPRGPGRRRGCSAEGARRAASSPCSTRRTPSASSRIFMQPPLPLRQGRPRRSDRVEGIMSALISQVRDAPAQAARRRDRGQGARAHQRGRHRQARAPRRLVDVGPVAQDGRLPRVPRPDHGRHAGQFCSSRTRTAVLPRAVPDVLGASRPSARSRAHRHDVRVRLPRPHREGARSMTGSDHLADGRQGRRCRTGPALGRRARARRRRARSRAGLAPRRHQRHRHGRLALHAQDARVPRGPPVVIVANDCTVQSGSFGVQGGRLLRRRLQVRARAGLPRLHIACNSGARIGLAEELKPYFKVAWNDPSNEASATSTCTSHRGGRRASPRASVDGAGGDEDGEKRFKLDDIVGETDGIGVENLRGSGMIAGETSRARTRTRSRSRT